jgi:hypothetical protein
MRQPRLAGLGLALVLAAPAALGAQQQPEKKPDQPKAEQPKPDAAKAEQAKADAPKADTAKANAAKASAVRADSAKTETKPVEAANEAKVDVKTEIKAGDVTAATPTQVISAVADVATTVTALQSAEIASVRLVNVAEVLDATSNVALDLALPKNAAEVTKLRQAADATPAVKAALAQANVTADRIVGISIASGVASVFHK